MKSSALVFSCVRDYPECDIQIDIGTQTSIHTGHELITYVHAYAYSSVYIYIRMNIYNRYVIGSIEKRLY